MSALGCEHLSGAGYFDPVIGMMSPSHPAPRVSSSERSSLETAMLLQAVAARADRTLRDDR